MTASQDVTAVFTLLPVLHVDEVTFTGSVGLSWDDPNWANDTFESDGVPIGPPHWKYTENDPKPVAFIRNTRPGLNIKLAGNIPSCGAKLRATLTVDAVSIVYETQIVSTQLNLTADAGQPSLPNYVKKTGATLKIEMATAMLGGAYGPYIPLETCTWSANSSPVFLLYGTKTANPAPFTDVDFPFPISYELTVRRLDLLTQNVNSSNKRQIAERVAETIYGQAPGGGGANPDVPIWGHLDPPPRIECYSGKVLAGVGLYMLGIPRDDIETKNANGCCAYPSTDDAPLGCGYGSDCTDQEGPVTMCPDGVNCSLYEGDGSCHPAHPETVLGELYYAPKHCGWHLNFDGSEVENFFKIKNDDGTWYYITVYIYQPGVIGSGGVLDEADKVGRYCVMRLTNATNDQYWFKPGALDTMPTIGLPSL